MGFNFGAFAGGAATSGMNTYQMLESIESQKKRDALLELQMQEMKQNMEDRSAIKGLAKDTYGKVGQEDLTAPLAQTTGIGPQQAAMLNTGSGDANFDAYDRQQQAQALRSNTEYQNRPDVQARLAQGSQAGLPTTEEQRTALAPTLSKYTEEQAQKDYANRLKGIDFEKGLSAEKGLMDVKKSGIELKRLQAEDDFATWHQTQQKKIDADPVGWMKENLSAYNNAKKGSHLDDGKTAEVVPSADGKTFSFVQKDSKGKIVGSTPIDRSSAAEALQHMAFDKYSALPGKYMEARKQYTTERGVAVQENELAAKLKVDLFGAQASQAKGAANASNAHAAVYGNMLKLAKDNAEAGAAMKPFIEEFKLLTPEEQAGTKGQSLLTQAATAAARKTGDITGIINSLKKPDADTKITVNPDGTVTQGGALYVPDPNKPGAYKPATGIGPSSLDKAIAAKLAADKNKSTPEANPEKPTSALPTKKTATPDFSVKGGRGIFTVSGLPSTYKTKADAEKAAQEAQKKRREAEVSSALERD